MTVLAFNVERHEYRVDGLHVPSVTQVIGFLNDYAGAPEAVLEAARDRGNGVHLATALDDRNDLDESSVDPVIAPYLAAWRRFRAESGFVPELIEQPLHSRRYRFAGTPDRYGYLPTRRRSAVIDIKATAKIMPATGPQTAAYAAMIVENWKIPGRPVRNPLRFTVQLKPDGTYRMEPHDDEADFPIFLAALNLFNWRKKHGA